MKLTKIGLPLWRLLPILLFPFLAMGSVPAGPAAVEEYDVAILNGHVMDPESGLDAVRNVGITAGKVLAISSTPIQGRIVIDANGLVVAPGFIDLHQHGQDATNYSAKAADGVTTALELEVGVADIDRWYAERDGKALINYGASIGHIPVRMTVMHDPGTFLPTGDAGKRVATDGELDEIKALIDKGLRRGALAVGLGPTYTPGATNWEVIEVFRVAARYSASCHVHIRGSVPSTSGYFGGFEEVLAAAAVTGAPLHVVHIQSTGKTDVVHELQMIAEARARGMDVTAEAYPYTRGMTNIESARYDGMENEPESVYAAMLWPATGEHLTRESFLRYRKLGGKVIGPGISEEDVRAAVVSPFTSIASDGGLNGEIGHPRASGTYAKVLGEYVRERKSLTLMDALRKMTLMPAERLEKRAPVFKDKGRIRVGADADIAIFDPARIIDKSTYEKPALHSEGMEFVLVNGVEVIRDGQPVLGVLPGQGVRAPVVP